MSQSRSSKPPIVRLSDLKAEELGDFFALLVEKTALKTRANKPYFSCRFRDLRRSVSFIAWEDGDFYTRCAKEWQPGMYFKVRATFGEHHQYGPQIAIHQIRPVTTADIADGFKESDFVERSRFDSIVMFDELRALSETTIDNEPLRKLTLTLLDRHRDKLLVLPATTRTYYPFPGGWLEHVLSVTKKCLWLVERYREHYPDLDSSLNKDVVAAGAILHEIGRVAELDPPEDLAKPFEPTVPGRLLGHLFLGRDLVRDAAREQGDVPLALVERLEHLMISHLNHPEWGSPRLPLIPEVLILHHADDLDAKLEMFARCLRKDASPGLFTERDAVLNRQLFKGRADESTP